MPQSQPRERDPVIAFFEDLARDEKFYKDFKADPRGAIKAKGHSVKLPRGFDPAKHLARRRDYECVVVVLTEVKRAGVDLSALLKVPMKLPWWAPRG